jgi:O-antigen ligase
VPAGNYSRIIGVAFLVGWAIHGFGDRSFGKAKLIALSLLGYWFCVVASTASSPNPELGLPFVEYLAKILLPFIAGVTLVDSVEKLRQLMWVIVCSTSYLAFEANLAYFNGYDFTNGQFLAIDNNAFSILMATSFGFALVLSYEDTVAWRRYLCFGIAAAMAHVPMLAMSRGGMLGILAAAAVATIVIPRSLRKWRLNFAIIVAGSILAGPSVVKEFASTFNDPEQRDESAQGRLDLWRDCTDAMMKNPLFGIGVNHWPIVSESYGWPKGKAGHSTWFQTGAELGVPGISALLAFYGVTLLGAIRVVRARDDDPDPSLSTYARMVIVSLSGFVASASFVTVDGFELPFYVAMFGACTLKLSTLYIYEPSICSGDTDVSPEPRVRERETLRRLLPDAN